MILLAAINSKYIHSNPAVYSLKASAGSYKHIVEIAEYTINNQMDYILQDIYKKSPEVLCFSCYIWNISYVEMIAGEFHKLCPDIPIWLGGPEVSFNTKEYLIAHPCITGIMIGEGEETFKELCHYYNNKGGLQLTDIKSLVFTTHHNEIIETAPRIPIDINSIPFYYTDKDILNNRIIYYESSRGCPFSCSYCLSCVDKKLRFRNLDLVKNELSVFLSHNVKQVKFIDRTFNCNHAHAYEIWSFIKEKDNGITNFHFEISADLLNEAEIKLITSMRPGLIQLEIGVQSTNEKTIGAINRTTNISRLKEVVLAIRNSGNIHQHLDLIAGLPYEDFESFKSSFDEIINLWPSNLQLGFLKVLKGSYIYDSIQEYGIEYKTSPPYEVLFTKWLKYSDIIKIKTVEEMLEVYYNSGQFEVTMKLIDVIAESLFDFFYYLGAYYIYKGLDNMNHTRIKRCEILLDFLERGDLSWIKNNVSKPDLEVFQESLVFDLYYREKCKTRPPWAMNQNSEVLPEMKSFSYRMRKKGIMIHVEAFHYRFPGKNIYNLTSLPERIDSPVLIKFDYDHRDPISHQALTEELRDNIPGKEPYEQ